MSGVATEQIGVLLLDDHRVFAESLAIGLGATAELRCRGIAHTVDAGVRLAETTDGVDVAVVDLDIPAAGGLAAIPLLKRLRPGIAAVVLTAYPRPDLARAAHAAGAVGFLGKGCSLEEIAATVRGAARGLPFDATRGDLPAETHDLSPREIEVLRCLGAGLDAARIADALNISLYTSRDHIRAILAKLDVRSQLEAVVTADRLGIITVSMRF